MEYNSLPYADALARRLLDIIADWDADDTPPNLGSLQNMLQFLVAHPKLPKPRIYADDLGEFTIEWGSFHESSNVIITFSRAGAPWLVMYKDGMRYRMKKYSRKSALMKWLKKLKIVTIPEHT